MAEPNKYGEGLIDRVLGKQWQEPYLIPETQVLKNKLGIRDDFSLAIAEGDYTSFRQIELLKNPIAGNFDLAHLQAIHKHLFQDVYEWAGKIRTIDISKGAISFCPKDNITAYAAQVFGKLEKDRVLWERMSGRVDLPVKLGTVLGDVNALHPFREGNGRAQREFIRVLGLSLGLKIDWRGISQDVMIKASIESATKGNEMLIDLIKQHSRPCEPRKMNLEKGIKP